jgi:hypothetical protein
MHKRNRQAERAASGSAEAEKDSIAPRSRNDLNLGRWVIVKSQRRRQMTGYRVKPFYKRREVLYFRVDRAQVSGRIFDDVNAPCQEQFMAGHRPSVRRAMRENKRVPLAVSNFQLVN